jgi:hypothetical protein
MSRELLVSSHPDDRRERIVRRRLTSARDATARRGDRDPDAAPPHVLPPRSGVDGTGRGPARGAGLRGQRPDSLPVVLQAVRAATAEDRAPSRPAGDDGSDDRHPRGNGRRGEDRARPAATRAAAPPVRRGGPNLGTTTGLRCPRGAGVHDVAVPRGGVRRRPVPDGGVRRRARALRAARGRALVRCERTRPRPGGAGAAGRRTGHRRHRHPLADGLAVPRARVPAHLLGRRNDARPAAGGGRIGRDSCVAAQPVRRHRGRLPGRGGWSARMAGGRRHPRRRRARARGDRAGSGRRGRRGAARVPARDVGAARRRPGRDRARSGPR